MAARVMIVDDEAVIRDGIRARVKLLGEGFRVVSEYQNGEEALPALGRGEADILLLDIRMPRMDGIALLRAMRESGIRTYTIVVSGYRDFDYVREAMRCGASDYLLKPIDPAEFAGVMGAYGEAGEGAEGAHADLIEYVLEYIGDTLGLDLSLSKVAGHFGYHPAYLSKLIKNHTGMGYSAFLTHLRMERARRLLAQRHMTVTEIAMTLGFNDLAYFCRVFKRECGMTPQRYRSSGG